MIHLYWLWRQGPETLRGVSSAGSLCSKIGLTRAEVTTFLDDTNCPRCKELAGDTTIGGRSILYKGKQKTNEQAAPVLETSPENELPSATFQAIDRGHSGSVRPESGRAKRT